MTTNTEREYISISDFLFDHGEQIRSEYLGDPMAPWMPTYTFYRREIDLLLAVMDAVRLLPGLDLPPGVTNMFDDMLAKALATYREDRPGPERP